MFWIGWGWGRCRVWIEVSIGVRVIRYRVIVFVNITLNERVVCEISSSSNLKLLRLKT